MKKITFFGILLTSIIILSDCKKDDANSKPLGLGTYLASGTMTYTVSGDKKTVPVTSVEMDSTSLTIYASAQTPEYTYITVYLYKKTGVVAGTYTTADASIMAETSDETYYASIANSSTSCSIKLSTISSSSISGTFTTNMAPYYYSGSNIDITNGSISCSIKSKVSK